MFDVTPPTASPQIPLPPGAVNAEAWEVNRDGSIDRFFWGTQRTGSRWTIQLNGRQSEGGEVIWRTPWMSNELSQEDTSAAELRQFAADMLAAADELEGLES